MASYISTLVAFVVIVYIVVRYVWPPLNRVSGERQAAIEASLDDARDNRELLRNARSQYEASKARATEEADALLEQARRLSAQIREELSRRAREDYDTQTSRAEMEIERTVKLANEELQRQLADEVIEATRRVLERELTTEIQQALVEEAALSVESAR